MSQADLDFAEAALAKMSTREVTAAFAKVTASTKGLTASLSVAPMAHIPFGTVLKHRDTKNHFACKLLRGNPCTVRIMVIDNLNAITVADTLTEARGIYVYHHDEWELA